MNDNQWLIDLLANVANGREHPQYWSGEFRAKVLARCETVTAQQAELRAALAALAPIARSCNDAAFAQALAAIGKEGA